MSDDGKCSVKIKPGKGNSVLSLQEIHWTRSSDDTAMEWSLKERGRESTRHTAKGTEGEGSSRCRAEP